MADRRNESHGAPVWVGVSASHTSVPVRRDGLELMGSARQHVLVGASDHPAAQGLLRQWQRSEASGSLTLICPTQPPYGVGEACVLIADGDQLGLLLRDLLADAEVGIRLYAIGEHDMVDSVEALGLAAGLMADEMELMAIGGGRRVYCVHCRTVTPGIETGIAACGGCGRMLIVYYHFSRRLGAYLGYQADAETPGQLDLDPEAPSWA